MAHQSLYRRYRPRRFGEVRGQDHVVRALQNAVRGQTEGHAYLFSGPRGTGKTSTARILAKALNCEHLVDGEPDCECSSCLEIEAGRSFDLFELDAASNNGVDAIRELIERSVVGSPGRTKVYILDEVHMLSGPASNALLKTLEEPPDHVCFVLATTDPQKVLPTIRSRTQHFEFQLLSAQELEDYVRWIAADAPLDVDDEAISYVVRQGRGSARDTLSALDQVVAAGGVINRPEPVDQLLQAVADQDTGVAIVAVAEALALGHDPRVLADAFLTALRDTFLLSLDVEVPHLVAADRDRLGEWAARLGTATLTRSMEAVGAALVDMRQAADPRVPLEVALVRLTTASVGTGDGAGVPDGLLDRIAALERAVAAGGTAAAAPPAPAEASTTRTAPVEPAEPSDRASGPSGDSPRGPAEARAALGALRAKQGRAAPSDRPAVGPAPSAPEAPRPAPKAPSAPRPVTAGPPSAPKPAPPPADAAPPSADAAPPSADAPAPAAPPPTAPPASSGPVDRDALSLAFGDVVLPALKGVGKAVYSGGRFVAVTDQGAVFALENAPTRDRAEKYRSDVEAALSEHLGAPVTLVLIDAADAGRYESGAAGGAATGPPRDPGPVPTPVPVPEPPAPVDEPVDVVPAETALDDATDDDDHTIIDVTELEDADVATSGIDKLTKAFPGAVLVDGGEGSP